MNSKLTPTSIEFWSPPDPSTGASNRTAIVGNSSDNTITLKGTDDAQTCLLKGLTLPTEATDAATKAYVDQNVWKVPVRAAASRHYNLDDCVTDIMIDDVNLKRGNRFLLTRQINSVENGIYEIVGTTRAVRTEDFDENARIVRGVTVFVTEGLNNSKHLYHCSAADGVSTIGVGTHPIEFHVVGIVKKPVSVVLYFNVDIATLLYGGETINGHTLLNEQRVLLTGQSDPKQNGIYIIGVNPGEAHRSSDFGKGSCPVGMMVDVSNINSTIMCTNLNPNHRIGLDALEFAFKNWRDPIKKPVRAVKVNSVFESSSDLVNGLEVDGVSLVVNDRLLIASVDTASSPPPSDDMKNMIGIWIIGETSAVRSLDFINRLDPIGATVIVREGTSNSNVVFTCKTSTPYTMFDCDIKTTGAVKVGGAVTAVNFLASSDRRLKKNFVNLVDSLDKIRHINGVKFYWKDSGLPDVGFVAQEVQDVFPEVVMTGSDGFLKVDYARVVVLLLEAVKTMDMDMTVMKQRLRQLDGE